MVLRVLAAVVKLQTRKVGNDFAWLQQDSVHRNGDSRLRLGPMWRLGQKNRGVHSCRHRKQWQRKAHFLFAHEEGWVCQAAVQVSDEEAVCRDWRQLFPNNHQVYCRNGLELNACNTVEWRLGFPKYDESRSSESYGGQCVNSTWVSKVLLSDGRTQS